MADDIFEDLLSIGVGTGAGVYAFRRGIGRSVADPLVRQNKNLLVGRLQGLESNSALKSAVKRSRIDSGMAFLDDLGPRLSKANLGSDIVRQEWTRAMESTIPDVSLFNRFPLKDDPLKSVGLNLRKNPSLYTFDVFDKFRYNLEAMIQSGAPYKFTGAGSMLGADFGLLQSRKMGPPSAFKDLVSAMGGPGQYQFERLGADTDAGVWTAYRRRGQNLEKIFTVPQAFAAEEGGVRGLIRSGDNLQNLYAPGLFQQVDAGGAPVGDMLTFGEYKIQRLTDVARQVQAGEIQGTMEHALRAASTDIDKMLPFVGPDLGGALSPEAVYRARQFTAVDPSGSPLVGAAKRQFVEQYSEQMGFVPTGGSARFTLGSPEEIFGGFTSEIDYARKPWQRIRGFTPTEDAMTAIQKSQYGGAEFNFVDSPFVSGEVTGGRPSAARLKTLYLDDNQIEALRGLGFPVGDGELLVNKSMSDQLQVSRLRRLRVTDMSSDLASQVMQQVGPGSARGTLSTAVDLERNALIGRTLEGALETAQQPTRILGAAPVAVRTLGGEASTAVDLLLEETLSATGSSKVFGGLKGQARRLDFGSLSDEVIDALQVSRGELEGVGAIARAADIKASKDPSKYLMQQFSGVMAFARDAAAEGLDQQQARRLLATSAQRLQAINELPGGVQAKSAAIREMAQGLGLSGTRMDMIFGGGKSPLVGIAALAPGDPKALTGAGKRGTFEPRLLSLLEGGAFGQYGEDVAGDFLTRLYHGRPEVTAMNRELEKTLRSITGDYAPGEGVPVYTLADLKGEAAEKVRATGGFISTGVKEMPYIHMPGYEQAPAMRPRLVGGNQVIQGSPVAQIFKEIERDIGLVAKGEIGTEELLGRFDADRTGYISQLWRAYAPGGKGQGAVSRGKLLGSRFLTAVSDIGDAPSGFQDTVKGLTKQGVPQGRVIGLPENMAEQMFQEVESIYGKSSTADMRKLFLEGKAIGGVSARHPFIGPFSAQPVLMVRSQTKEPVMLVPETTRRVQAMGKEFDITEGIMTGLALDKDADIPMAIALNKDMEKNVREGLMHAGSKLQRDLKAYESHNIRSQLLKLSPSAEKEMTAAQKAAAAVGKLGITDEEVGRVSTALTRARAAIVNSSMGQADITRGLSLLEWMEQQPISGKHLDPSQVLEGIFEQQMYAIRHGAGGRPDILNSVVREMLDHSSDAQQNAINKALLGSGLTLEGGQKVQGFELEKTSLQISKAMEQFMAKGAQEQQAAIQDFLSPPGAKTMKRDMLSRALSATSIDPSKGVRGFQQTALAQINAASTKIGSKVRPFAKPAMIGLAAAGTAAFLMSGSPNELPPPRFGGMDTSPPVRNTNQSRDEVSPPPSPQLGAPAAGSMMANSARMLDESAAQKRQSIRAKINAGNITPQQRAALSRRLGSNYNGSLNMNVRDSRRSLNNTTVTDILDQ